MPVTCFFCCLLCPVIACLFSFWCLLFLCHTVSTSMICYSVLILAQFLIHSLEKFPIPSIATSYCCTFGSSCELVFFFFSRS
uniref:Uncharacterized protein n=1 Tax=Rhipicephalus microplus TaxID=6941 RepID=A0A6M2DAT5_RHIMP